MGMGPGISGTRSARLVGPLREDVRIRVGPFREVDS